MTFKIPKKLKRGTAARRSRKQERECAKKFGGKVTPRSGAGAFEKGDVRIKGLARVECKTTTKKSFSVTKEIIEKMEGAAMPAGELPVLEIEFLGNYKNKLYIMPEWAFSLLMGKANAAEKNKQ